MGANGTVYNEGVNGFHIFTVVTDGYGHFIAEDMHGNEIARVDAVGEDNRQSSLALCELVLATARAADPNREAGEVPTQVQLA